MKKYMIPGRGLCILLISSIIYINAYAQVDCNNKKQVAKWYKTQEWLNGCKLNPHKSINQQAFAKEYFGNKEVWDKTFEWLKANDLNTLAPGRYIIDEGNSIATISEAPAPEMNNVKWEIHKNFNDLLYIIKGKALMGVVPVSKAKVIEPYQSRRDTGFYEAEGSFFTAEPGTFFIFTPDDVHRSGIKVEGVDVVRKVVIKVRAAKKA